MERRLQERCAELQREVFRLQGAHNNDGYKSLEKHPVALPRQVLPRTNNKTGSSEHEDEGISSSETGQSLSPEPILILPQNATKKYSSLMSNSNEYNGNSTNSSSGINNNSNMHLSNTGSNNSNCNTAGAKDDDVNTTIEEVIEELENIVHDAEQDMQQGLNNGRSKSPENLVISAYHVKPSHLHSTNNCNSSISNSNNCMNKIRNDQFHQEKEIVPVNLLPQPPKKMKSRSLSHLLSGGSEFDESDYGVIMANNETRISYYDDIDMEIEHSRQHGYRNEPDGISGSGGGGGGGGGICIGGEPNPDLINQTSTNRELLNVIMDAREKDENIFMTAPGHYGQMLQSGMHDAQSLMPKTAPQKFNGVFFMTEMSKQAKYAPDITAALEARRVSKSIERLESYGSSGLDSMIDIIMTSERKQEMKNAIAKAPNNFAALRDMALNSTFSLRTKSPTSTLSPDGCGIGVGSGGGGGGGHQSSSVVYTAGIKSTRMAYACNGSKLSDLPSGLY